MQNKNLALVIKTLEFLTKELKAMEQPTESAEPNVVELAKELVAKTRNDGTRALVQGILDFHRSNDYISEKQKQVILNTHKSQKVFF